MNPETFAKLKAPFPAADHKERKLPGGGRWFFVPWQTIRERLDEAAPGWSCTYSDPLKLLDGETVIRCRLTIEGITREGVGVAYAAEFNDSGKRKGIGSPVESAIADAFKNAAEQFGVAAYLDDQAKTVAIMQSKGDGRAWKFAKEQEWVEHGGKPKKKPKPPQLPMQTRPTQAEIERQYVTDDDLPW